MKRFILLGMVILLAGSVAMATIIDPIGSIYGNYSGEDVHIGVYNHCDTHVIGSTIFGTLAVTDTLVGAIGSLTVDVGASLYVEGFTRLGVGNMGTINVEGTMTVDGHFDYDGNSSLSGAPGVYGVLNVTGNGVLNGGQHMIWGGYDVAHPWDVTISDNAVVNAGLKPVYIGGTQGSATVTMSGNAQLINETGQTGYYDNQLNIGWNFIPDSGKLIVEAGNTVKFRHIEVKSGGTVEFILDENGKAGVLQAELPVDVDPDGGQDAYMSFAPGSLLNIVTTGVGSGAFPSDGTIGSLPAIDLATTNGGWSNLRWDTPGTWDATLAIDGVVMQDWSNWRLREKPGDPTTLQAYFIPEPTTMALLGLGGLAVALRRKK